MEEVAKRPFFSIIIPVYNVAPYLRECLDSVLAQTFGDWEAICVDDGSTDESGVILDEYAGKDKRFRVFSQPNSGPGAARNRALEVSNGEWIIFLDADDLLAQCSLQIIVNFANGTDSVRFGMRYFCGTAPFMEEKDDKVQVQYDCLSSVTKEVFDCAFCQYAYKRGLIGRTRFASYIRGEDKLFQVLCLDKANKITRIDKSLYYYRQNSASLTHSGLSFRGLYDELQWRLDWFKYLREPSSKKVEWHLFRRQGIYLVEQMPVQIQSLGEKERKALLRKWYAALPSFRTLPFGWMQWLVLRILLILPTNGWVVSVFCKVPYKCRRFISGALKVHLNQ